MQELIGETLGPYRILEKVGEGGMGVVYKGLQESLHRYVAVKVLREQLAQDQQFIARFRREALAVAKLSHPGILHIFDAGVAHGVYYLVVDYVEGGALRDLVRQGPLAVEHAISIAVQVADTLDYAHREGLVHRDVKPANILLTGEGHPLLTDFGIARALDASTRLTTTGGSIGTPEYMAPEQAMGEPVDGRTDIYALGIVLYEMLAGRVPFRTRVPLATLYKQLNDPPPPLRRLNPTVPAGLEAVVNRALAKRPADRYQQAGEFAAALRQAAARARAPSEAPPRRDTPTPAERPRRGMLVPFLLAAIGALFLILVVSGMYLASRDRDGGQGAADAARVVTQVVTPKPAATVVITSAPAPTEPALPTPTRGDGRLPTETSRPTEPASPPTETPRPATAPTKKPAPTEAPLATCPGWYATPEPDRGVLLIENHIGEELQVEQIQGGSGQWKVAAKQADTPGRLLLQLPAGDHEFLLYVATGGRGHIQLKLDAGQSYVSPVWFNYRYDEYVYPLVPPPGCW